MGSGAYRIGSSVEFDWCAVTAAQTFRSRGLETIIINCNPETVSTDYDLADKLYFEELTLERVSDIYEIEKSAHLIMAFGGQIPNNLALSCYRAGMKILGTDPKSIDLAENRHKFSRLLDTLGIEQPAWEQLKSLSEASVFARRIGFPVMVRPSYVLSGSAMNVANSSYELKTYLQDAVQVSSEYPVVISKFIDNAKEIEIDGVAAKGELVIYAISEHVENAGVHSGDATLVLPPQRLYLETVRQIKTATKKIIKALNINGPFNIQFLAKDNRVMVIELNLRASRSFPFVSKVTGYNFVEMASKIMLGEKVKGDFKTIDIDYVGVKAPQFSFNRIKGADPKLRVEMLSTGEVACFGHDLDEAYLKSLLSTGFKKPGKSVFLSIGGDENKLDFLPSALALYNMGLKIYATDHTSQFLTQNGIRNTRVYKRSLKASPKAELSGSAYKISEDKHPSVVDLMHQGKIELVINISLGNRGRAGDGFIIRRTCVDLGIPLQTNLQAAIALSHALSNKKIEDLNISSWDQYLASKS